MLYYNLQRFGSRGAMSGMVIRLPNYKKAKITGDKLKNYLLNPQKGNGKHNVFNSLGYNMQNFSRLKSDILEGLKNNEAKAYSKNKYGNRLYEVVMPLGIGEKHNILTVWQIDKGSKIPRLITAYPE